jgi:hypothetical protein
MNPASVTSLASAKSDGRDSASNGRCRDPQHPTYPFDFSILKEGDHEPLLGKKIASLVSSDYDYIVFLDDQSFVWWDLNDDVLVNQYGDAITRVAVLESIQIGDQSNIDTFRRLVAEGVARLCEQNPKAAAWSFDRAEEWIRARNQERARVWYLSAASAITLPLLIALLVLVLWKESLQASSTALRPSVFDVLAGACAGAVGALFSVTRRSGQIELDVSAGRKLHYIEGVVRVLVGTIGAALFAVGIKADLVLGFVTPLYAFPALLVFCMVAGVSERLVPSFVEQVESTGGYSAPQSSPTTGGGGANGRDGKPKAATAAADETGER